MSCRFARSLSGALRDEMLALLTDAKDNGRSVYGALYELADEELVDALARWAVVPTSS